MGSCYLLHTRVVYFCCLYKAMPEKTFYYNIIPEERKELPLVNAISGYSIAGKPDSPQSNNDGFYIDEATGIVIVCDGAGDRVYTKDTVQIVLNTYRNILEDSRKYGKIGDALPTIPPKTITDAKTFALLGVSYASQDLQGFFESLSRFIKFEQMAMATTIALEMEVDDTIFTAHAGDSRIIVEYRDGTIRQTVDESAAYMAQEVGLLNAVQATRIDTILSNGITEADFNRCVLPNGDTRLADTADEADYWQWRDDGVWVKPFRLERQCLRNYITAPSLAYQGLH